MTWNPLKKNHLTMKPTLATDIIPRHQDRELEQLFLKLTVLEETTKKIQKEIRHYMDSMIRLNKAEHRLTSDLMNNQLCHQDTVMRELVEEYLAVTTQLTDSVIEVTKICQKAVIEPLKKFSAEFCGIAAILQKREHALQEVAKQELRQRKLEEKEKTATNVLKREQAKKTVQQAKEEVENIHSRLLSELPQFYAQRCTYFTPCLQALIRAQVDYHGVTVALFTKLTSISPLRPTVLQSLPESQTQESLQNHLAALQTLKIVRPSPTQAALYTSAEKR